MTAPHPEAALSAREAEKTAKEALAEAVTFLEMDDEASKPGTDLYTWLKAVAQPLLSTAHTATAGDGGERVRHVKRGTEYEVLGEAEAQVSIDEMLGGGNPVRLIADGDRVTVYRCFPTGKLWCRFTDEFRDGRFVTIAQAPAVQAPAGEDVALAKAITQACSDPGRLAGLRGDRTVDGWRVDAVLAVLGALAASPTPTDAQPKAARPVGDEALREALEFYADPDTYLAIGFFPDRPCGEFMEDFSDEHDPGYPRPGKRARAALAAHPTTGQETVAAPRDGGVRETLTSAIVREAYEHFQRGAEFPCSASAMREAIELACRKAALPAPGSAGPGECENGLLATLPPSIVSDCESQALNLANLWTNGNEGARTCILAALLRIHAGYATPSPAQEPGTGDTGAKLAEAIGVILHVTDVPKHKLNDAEFLRGVVCCAKDYARAADAILRPTPATTAETRGPAEGAR